MEEEEQQYKLMRTVDITYRILLLAGTILICVHIIKWIVMVP